MHSNGEPFFKDRDLYKKRMKISPIHLLNTSYRIGYRFCYLCK